MRIITADDAHPALEALTQAIAEAAPTARVHAFAAPWALLRFARDNPCDAAFLETSVGGMPGAELAGRLRDISPDINIIFVASSGDYALEAFALHASGYILKPVTADKVRIELDNLRRPVHSAPQALIKVKCFGNFEAFTPAGDRLCFKRSKAKELLAYLVYRGGASCTAKEIAAVLFENSEYSRARQDYVQKIISSLLSGLRAAGAEAIVTRGHNSLSVKPSLIDCDFYRFTRREAPAVGAYAGEFMSQYSWAEFMTGYLDRMQQR